MKVEKVVQKHIATLCVFTLLFSNVSPFITFADDGDDDRNEVITSEKSYKYSETQDSVGSGSFVVKNFSDTQDVEGTKNIFTGNVLESFFSKGDEVLLDMTSTGTNVKVYGFTLGDTADSSDVLTIVGPDDKEEFISNIQKSEFAVNYTGYNEIFDDNRNFVSVKMSFVDGQNIELVDFTNLVDLDPTIQAGIDSLVGDTKGYVEAEDSSLIGDFVGAISASNLKFVPLNIDYEATGEMVVLGEVFTLDTETYGDNKYIWEDYEGGDLTLDQIVVKQLADTQDADNNNQTKDIFSENTDLDSKEFGLSKSISIDVLYDGVDETTIYGFKTVEAGANKLYFEGVVSRDELLEKIDSIEFSKDITKYKDIFTDKEFLSLKINFASGGILNLIDLVDIDSVETKFTGDTELLTKIQALETLTGDDIDSIMTLFDSNIDFVPANMIADEEVVILGAVFDTEITIIRTHDIGEEKTLSGTLFDYTNVEIAEDQVYKIIVNCYDEEEDNKCDFNKDESFRKSNQVIEIPHFENTLGELWLENMTISDGYFANDVILLQDGFNTVENLLTQIKSVHVGSGSLDNFYRITVDISKEYEFGKIVFDNVIRKTLFDASGIVKDEDGFLDEDNIEALITSLFDVTLVSQGKWALEKDLSIEKLNVSPSVDNVEFEIELGENQHSEDGLLTIYEDEDMTIEKGGATPIDMTTMSGAVITDLDSVTEYFYKLDIQNTFNLVTKTGSFTTTSHPSTDISGSKGHAELHDLTTDAVVDAQKTFIVKVAEYDDEADDKNDLDGFRDSDQRMQIPALDSIKGNLIFENITISTGGFANDVLILSDENIDNTGALNTTIYSIEIKEGVDSYKTLDITLTNSGVISLVNGATVTDLDGFSNGILSDDDKELLVEKLFNKTILSSKFWEDEKELKVVTDMVDLSESGATIDTVYTGVINSGSLALYEDDLFTTQTGTTRVIDGTNEQEVFENLNAGSGYYYMFVLENTLNQNTFTGSFLTNQCSSDKHYDKDELSCVNNHEFETIEKGEKYRDWVVDEDHENGGYWGDWHVTCTTANYIPDGEVCVFDNVQYPVENIVDFKGSGALYDYHDFSTGAILVDTTLGIRLANYNSTTGNKNDLTSGFRRSDQKVLLPDFDDIKGTLVIENMTVSTGGLYSDDILILEDDIASIGAFTGRITGMNIEAGSGEYTSLIMTLDSGGKIKLLNGIDNSVITSLTGSIDGEGVLEQDTMEEMAAILFNKSIVSKVFFENSKNLTLGYSVIPAPTSVEFTLNATGTSSSGAIVIYSDAAMTQFVGSVDFSSSSESVTVSPLDTLNEYYYEIILSNALNRLYYTGSTVTTYYPTDDLTEYKGSGSLHVSDYNTDFELGTLETLVLDLSKYDVGSDKKVDLDGFRDSDHTILMPDFDEIEGTLIFKNITIGTDIFANDVLVLSGELIEDELYNEFRVVSIEPGTGDYSNISFPLSGGGEIIFENAVLTSFLTDNVITTTGSLSDGEKTKLIDILYNKTFVTKAFVDTYKDLDYSHDVSNKTNTGARVNVSFSGTVATGSLAIYDDVAYLSQIGDTVYIDNGFTGADFENLTAKTTYYYRFYLENAFNQKIGTGSFMTEACASDEHIEGNNCVNNVDVVDIENGTKTKVWDNGVWGDWTIDCDDGFRVSGDMCVEDGGGDRRDDLSGHKSEDRGFSYTGTTISDTITHTVRFAELDGNNEKINLAGYRESAIGVLLPSLDNIEGTLDLENMTFSNTKFSNDVLVLDSSIDTAAALNDKIADIEVKAGSGAYNTIELTMTNSGVVRFTNVVEDSFLTQFIDEIVEGKFSDDGRLMFVEALFNKDIITTNLWDTQKSLSFNHNVTDLTQNSATITADITGYIVDGNLSVYDDEPMTSMIEDINVDNTFTGALISNLTTGSGYYYKFILENRFNQLDGTGSFVVNTCPTGEHLEGVACVGNLETVQISNGTKTRIWSNGVWGAWGVQCKAGYAILGESCIFFKTGGGGSAGNTDGLINTPVGTGNDNEPTKTPETNTGTTTTNTGTTTSISATSTGTITEEPKPTNVTSFGTNSKYFNGYIPGEKANLGAINDKYNFTSDEYATFAASIQSGVKANFNNFAGLLTDPEFAFYANKMLFGYEEVLKGVSVLDKGAADERVVANANSQMTQGIVIYNQAIKDLLSVIDSKYDGVQEVKIGTTTTQQLKVFTDDNVIGKIVEEKVDDLLEGKLTESNLVEVMEIRNSALIEINKNLKELLASGLSVDDVVKSINFKDLLTDSVIEKIPVYRDEEQENENIEENTNDNGLPVNPRKRELLINLINELVEDNVERLGYISEINNYTREQVDELVSQFIKLKIEKSKQ